MTVSRGGRATIRVALVLNGGVSLAVWMGGVVHEVDRLTRASAGDPDPALDVWRKVCELAKREVIVDVVAGTSAGGLNGSVLADAIARRRVLPPMRDLWLRQGRLQRRSLLRPAGNGTPDSVLDGGFFAEAVTEVLTDTAETASTVREDAVTLLVTASALEGSSVAVVDAGGEKFTAGDNRRVYRFHHDSRARTWTGGQQYTQSPSDFDTARDELQLAARASAGFPFAFEPVQETADLNEHNIASGGGQPAKLIDGGLLDNAPFGPLMAELQNRPRSDVGERWVAYVVPSVSPDDGNGPGDSTPMEWTALPGRLFGLSRESDLRDDVATLRSFSDESRSLVCSPHDMIRPMGPGSDLWVGAIAASDAFLDAYRRAAANAFALRCRRLNKSDAINGWRPTDEQIAAILGSGVRWLPTARQPCLVADDGVEHWQWSISTARRIARWISRDARRPDAPLSAETREEIAETEARLVTLKTTFRALREDAIRSVYSSWELGPEWAIVAEADSDARALADLAAELDANSASVDLSQEVGRLMNELVRMWSVDREIIDPNDDTVAELALAWQRILGVEILENHVRWQFTEPPPVFSLHLFSPDTRAEGTQLAGRLGGADWRWANQKLFGTRLGHFGAFGHEEFREWDWMWGRLDGSLALAAAMLRGLDGTPDVEVIAAKDALINQLLEEWPNYRDQPVTQESLPSLLCSVLAFTPRDLIARSAANDQTDFNAAIDDAIAMVGGASLITKPTSESRTAAGRAKIRGWVVRRALSAGGLFLKRLVRSSSREPSST